MSYNLYKINLVFLIASIQFWSCSGTKPIPIIEENEKAMKIVEPIPVIAPAPPKAISIISVNYDKNKMFVKWNSSKEKNFHKYQLLYQKGDSENVDTLTIKNNVLDTIFNLYDFDPTINNWFWILVSNNEGFKTKGKRVTHTLETLLPNKSILLPIEYDNILKIRWTMNRDLDFSNYTIYRSKSIDMEDPMIVFNQNIREDTLLSLPIDSIYYYQIGVQDYWGLESLSNIIKGDYLVQLWDKEFPLIGTKKINLSSNKIFGKIPKKLGVFINLEELILANNFLNGKIPAELWNLKKLRVIDFSNNQISGSIPSEIHKLNALLEIWLSNNRLNGELPYQIFSLKNLTHLNISNNKIEGNISEAIGNLINLEYLNLYDNQITGFIPNELGDLHQLEFLSLAGNYLQGKIPKELGNAKSLKSLALFDNALSGIIPKEITALPKLEYIGFFNNRLFGNVPSELMKNLNLSYLRLDNNSFNRIDNSAMCESGYDWENFVYFNVSKNQYSNPLSICFETQELRRIYISTYKK